jgi:putative transposase
MGDSGHADIVQAESPLLDVLEEFHSAYRLGLLTPRDVHYGAEYRVAARATVLAAAYAAHPERFSGGLPQPAARPTEVWINPTPLRPTERAPG